MELVVHIGARVVALADPGAVLVTRTVKDLVVGSGLVFQDRGEHELKGLPEPWHLYAAGSERRLMTTILVTPGQSIWPPPP